MGPGVSVIEPWPATCTVRARCTSVKVAVTLRAWLIVTTQVPVPVQPSPLQPVKVELLTSGDCRERHGGAGEVVGGAGEAAVDTGASLVIVPPPEPAGITVSSCAGWKVAVAALVAAVAVLMTSTHVPVPVQPPVPLQPVNTDVAFGVAVSVTVEPCANPCEQLAVQFMPGGTLVTVPPPVPAIVKADGPGLLEVTVDGLGGVHRDDAGRGEARAAAAAPSVEDGAARRRGRQA